jgi:EAL domain-containing protein (putative c-di-GMP-specific phosphodiesterase class I)
MLRDDIAPPTAGAERRSSLCFIVDPDHGFLQEVAKSLRGLGLETLELRGSARLAESVDGRMPDMVFLDLNPLQPYDCTRALISLKDCGFPGRVQLLGRCDRLFLEGFRRTGTDLGLAMLPALQKPISFTSIQKAIREQKLECRPVAPPDLSLKTALARDLVTFLYQPKIDLRQRRVIGAEAFARVSHPQYGDSSPAQFLAGADDEQLIELAARAIIRGLELCAKLEQLGTSLQVAINVSADTLLKLPVAELVAKHRPPGDRWPGLLLEIPEAQALNKATVLRETFNKLQGAKVMLAIDNFGRGNSSFSALRYLPFAEIKIDSQFVQGCAGNRGNANICKSMVQIAHSFSRTATAMGIETGEDAVELADIGCDIGQGHLFGKPMTEQQLAAMVTAGRVEATN